MSALDRAGTVRLRSRQVTAEKEASVAGVTFRVTGQERPQAFPMDFVPRIISPEVWRVLAAGTEQRARALDAFLDDIYGQREFVRAGHMTPESLDRAPGHRSTGRVQRPGRTRAHICGIDLVCGDDGTWFVLEDNVRVPSGIAFSHALRQMTTSLFGDLTGGFDLHAPDEAFGMIRETLEAAAPPAAGDEPQLAVVSSGPTDSAWFEHRLIAQRTGLPLVTPDRLTFRDGVLHYRAGRDLHRVDVMYARIDEDMLLSSPGDDGIPLRDGLLDALGAGRLTIANALGNGVADDKAVYASVPAMIDFYLGRPRSSSRSPPTCVPTGRSGTSCWTASASWWSSRSTGTADSGSPSGRSARRRSWPPAGRTCSPGRRGSSPRRSCPCPRCRPSTGPGCSADTWTFARSPTSDARGAGPPRTRSRPGSPGSRRRDR